MRKKSSCSGAPARGLFGLAQAENLLDVYQPRSRATADPRGRGRRLAALERAQAPRSAAAADRVSTARPTRRIRQRNLYFPAGQHATGRSFRSATATRRTTDQVLGLHGAADADHLPLDQWQTLKRATRGRRWPRPIPRRAAGPDGARVSATSTCSRPRTRARGRSDAAGGPPPARSSEASSACSRAPTCRNHAPLRSRDRGRDRGERAPGDSRSCCAAEPRSYASCQAGRGHAAQPATTRRPASLGWTRRSSRTST